jgi:hypothetical protein
VLVLVLVGTSGSPPHATIWLTKKQYAAATAIRLAIRVAAAPPGKL